MASKVAICNMALGALGVAEQIDNVDTERSAEARACKLYYDETVKEVLRDFPWPFATALISLALVQADPCDEWAFAYRYPTDCLFARRIPSGVRTDTRRSRTPFRMAYAEGGQVILCDREQAELEYTYYVTDPTKFPPDFTAALAMLLSVRIAPMVTGGDAFDRQTKNLKLYAAMLPKAQANSANEEQADEEPDPETISGR